ncbi:hypothetical protein JHK87_045105 [Glycine soja]|nr:hypothetical protein JHK87_045105 [Glycine soja]
MLASPSENRTRCRKRKRDSPISRRHQKHEEEEDDDDENPNAEEDLAERDYDSEDQTHHNHPNSQPHVETEVLSDHGVQMSQFPPVIKHSVNRPHSSVTTIVALERALHGIALTRFQNAPLDFGTDDFYIARKSSIESHLQQIRDGMAEEFLIKSWETHIGTTCRGVNWGCHSLDELRTVVSCVGGTCLASLCKLLAQDYRS